MISAPMYTPHERSLVGRLRFLGLDGERASAPRHDFRSQLRDQLLAEAGRTRGDRAPSAA